MNQLPQVTVHEGSGNYAHSALLESFDLDRSVPEELNVDGFEAFISEFSDELSELFGYLRITAKNAGADVVDRRHRPQAGGGVRYYTQGNKFCELDPKIREDHVWVFLPGADRAALMADGFESSEQDDWFKVRTMPEAVGMVKWILEAHDRRS